MSVFTGMYSNKKVWLSGLIIFVSVYSCVEVFYPELDNKAGLMVVDALITNESRSYDVFIYRSVSSLSSKTTYVKGAYVSVFDNSGKENKLKEVSTGHYITDNKTFFGEAGKKYILYIRTSGGDEYLSDTCTMYGNSTIDQVYFRKNQKYSENGIDQVSGVSFYVDGQVSSTDNCFLRWDFNEDWKILVQYPSLFVYNGGSSFTENAAKNIVCWKKAKSTDIIIHSFQDNGIAVVKNKEIGFFIPEQSDRFNVRYSILVNQYAISLKEYEYWNKLKETNEETGGIFERQPFSISGNIRNIRNSREAVLGYFQVATVSSKRLYVNPNDVSILGLPLFQNVCGAKVYQLGDMGETEIFRTIPEIYDYITRHDSVLVTPFYNDFGVLRGMVVSSHVCTDCGLSGDPKKPDFWIE
jgi:hypothetical protein